LKTEKSREDLHLLFINTITKVLDMIELMKTWL